MKKAFRPGLMPLESRALLSTGIGHFPAHSAVTMAKKSAPVLRGTVSAIGPTILATESGISTNSLYIGAGRLANKRVVVGYGFLLPGDPFSPSRQNYDYINIGASRPFTNYLRFKAITEPVAESIPSGPVTLKMQVAQAKGVFARYLGAVVSVNISLKPHKVSQANLTIQFSPA